MDRSSAPNLNLLRTLDALLAHGSVTAAARHLGLSQPALSAQLARLRRLFGDPLFVASGRHLVPTSRAEALRIPLRRGLQALEGLVRTQTVFDPATASGTLGIGGTDYVHAVLGGALIAGVRAQAPGLAVALMPFVADRAWAELENGRLDAAIVTSFVTLDEARRRMLFSERFIFVQRKGHPRGPAPPDLDAFCTLPHVLVSPEGGGFFGAVDRVLADLGRSRAVVVSLPSFLLAPAMLAGSDLVCVLPARLASAHTDRLDLLPLPLPVPGFDVHLVWHPPAATPTRPTNGCAAGSPPWRAIQTIEARSPCRPVGAGGGTNRPWNRRPVAGTVPR